MNNPPHPMSKAEIVWRLHEIIDYHLFESTSWPADIDAVRAFFRMLEEMGLEEAVPGTKDTRYTVLGIDCGAPLATYFIGAHDPMEIPMSLEQVGLIEWEEAEVFYSSPETENEAVLHRRVEMLVRRAYRRFCGMKGSAMQ